MTERSSGSGTKKVVQSQATMDKGMVSLGISKVPLSGGAPRASSTTSSSASSSPASASAKKAAKPKPVRKPKTAYLLWKESELKAAKDKINDSSTATTPTPAQWKALDEKVRTPFEEEAALDKARYEEEIAAAAAAEAATAADDGNGGDTEPIEAGETRTEGHKARRSEHRQRARSQAGENGRPTTADRPDS